MQDILQFYKGEHNNYVQSSKQNYIQGIQNFLNANSWYSGCVKGKVVATEQPKAATPTEPVSKKEEERLERIERIRQKNKRLATFTGESPGHDGIPTSNVNFNPVYEESPTKKDEAEGFGGSSERFGTQKER